MSILNILIILIEFSLYSIFPLAVPPENSEQFKEFHLLHEDIKSGGSGRSMSTQALIQLFSLAITVAIAIGSGLMTGDLILVYIQVFTILIHSNRHDFECRQSFSSIV